MKIKETSTFVIAELLPFTFCFHFHYIVSHWNLVNKISQEPLKPGSWYLDHRLCRRCRCPDQLLVRFTKFMTELSPFPIF